jgi:hypothetical protein
MMYLSRFTPDTARFAEFLACLWQGEVPSELVLHRWLYLDSGEGPHGMVLIWDGEEAARRWVDRNFGSFGILTHEPVTNATSGLAACLDRDLGAFGTWLRSRGTDNSEIERQLDVRRRGLEAQSQQAAAEAGRAWVEEQR